MVVLMKILGIEDVMREYGLSRKYATKLLNTKGCPVLPRVKGQKYRVSQEGFEEWLKNLKK